MYNVNVVIAYTYAFEAILAADTLGISGGASCVAGTSHTSPVVLEVSVHRRVSGAA